jgi:hypothetical protein
LKKCWKIHRKNIFVLKTAFHISLVFWKYTWQPITICTCWTQKSLKFFLSWKKIILATLCPKTLDKKIRNMTIFKVDFWLTKNGYCSKIILNYNIWTFICKKMSKTWPFLVSVSLKYCAEKRLLKTHVAFFMNVTVYVNSRRNVVKK